MTIEVQFIVAAIIVGVASLLAIQFARLTVPLHPCGDILEESRRRENARRQQWAEGEERWQRENARQWLDIYYQRLENTLNLKAMGVAGMPLEEPTDVLGVINTYRAQLGMPPLSPDEVLIDRENRRFKVVPMEVAK